MYVHIFSFFFKKPFIKQYIKYNMQKNNKWLVYLPSVTKACIEGIELFNYLIYTKKPI